MQFNKSFFVLAFFAIILCFSSCKKESQEEIKASLVKEVSVQANELFKWGDTINIKLLTKDDSPKNVDSIVAVFDESPETTLRGAKSIDTQLSTGKLKLGLHRLAYTIYYDSDKSFVDAVDFAIVSNISPATHTLKITKEYAHNPANFTQGFQLIDGNIYEGTGMYGESTLQKYDLNTGKVSQKVNLDQRFFGEGITVLNNRIYQLTWEAKMGFVYDKNTFQQLNTFAYPYGINEGWGLTNNGKELIMSDGSSNIYFLNADQPDKIQKVISVWSDKRPIDSLNALQFINGKLYANVWMNDHIVEIDPENGRVLAYLSANDIVHHVGKKGDTDNVLNGIAYNDKTKRMVVTGKRWPKSFEVEVK